MARAEPEHSAARNTRANGGRRVELVDRSSSVPAGLARQIVARPGTLFYRVLIDPRGRVLDVSELGRFPSQRLGFAVDIRDGTCRWVTCTARASVAATPITSRNGRKAGPGVVAWTTPTGHGYRVEAEPVPVETWWPPQSRTRCPCDHCDTPLNEDSDILAAQPPGDTLDGLTAADLEHVTAAA